MSFFSTLLYSLTLPHNNVVLRNLQINKKSCAYCAKSCVCMYRNQYQSIILRACVINTFTMSRHMDHEVSRYIIINMGHLS